MSQENKQIVNTSSHQFGKTEALRAVVRTNGMTEAPAPIMSSGTKGQTEAPSPVQKPNSSSTKK